MHKPEYLTDNDWKLLGEKYKDLNKVIKKLNKNYPVQYLIGNVEFYGYPLLVNKHVLIPRFETETLVEKTIEYLKKQNLTETRVLEFGTGSGAIAITLKKELPLLSITAVDKSGASLKIAKKNSELNNTEIQFIKKDLTKYRTSEKFGLVISNPPYISVEERIDPKTKYEPQMALFAKNNGCYFYEKIIKQAVNYIGDKSILAFEIGETQGPYLKGFAKTYFPNAKILVEKDLACKDRYLFIINE